MTTPAESPGKVTVDINIGCNEWKLQGRITIAAGLVTVGELLPVAWMLSDAIVKESVKVLDEMGSPISCKKGCGACCRNLVAISQPEARRLRQLVEELPEPRRSAIRARFSATLEKFATAGLLGQLRKSDDLSDDEYGELAQAYFDQKVACPFLEEESCSIYAERPTTCREYLVTSPAENCSRPTADTVRRVRLPLKVFNAVARWQTPPAVHVLERWVPLILALEWAEAHPNDPPARPGQELLRELLDNLTGKTTTEARS